MENKDTARRSLAGYLTTNPDGYTALNGIISSPGKFEGEPLFVPYYWGLVLEGCADESGQCTAQSWDAIRIWEDVTMHPSYFPHCYPDGETPETPVWIVLYESDSGFVTHDLATEAQFRSWQADPDYQDFGDDEIGEGF